ncbi:dTDP-4-dehydrorhamnose reductase [Sulfolobus acidocaldarius SUSAZ]|nr:dTDP-4-dehydrorhamnose reductase [Sulfolobus acidocaldarius SUSAZ]
MKVGVTDEGEFVKSIGKFFDEIVVLSAGDRVIKERPDVVIHTYEIPYDEANSSKALAWNINTWHAINIAKSANKIGITNVYLSTFLLFDGKKGYYSETSTPSPLNYYGLTKLVGESGIMSLGNYLIIRLGLVTSFNYRSIAYYLYKASLKKRRIKCNTNFYVSPITLNEASEITAGLIKKGIKGVVNVAGKRRSMVEVCRDIGESMDVEVVPFEGKYFDFSLDTWLLKSLGFNPRS